ncbi:hypothetical protein PSENEW3n2_00001871 [Picochlorum sp. SENEW3]|nr:hypothetical protein PSENEW3n2_00001871 [Picochlorum sp. SENEW3]WPT14641.1 hypothetical protein PSENEW3_00001871 [Picochlorum sp. SENEW3]
MNPVSIDKLHKYRIRTHLPMSLLVRMKDIPPEGYTLSEKDRTCNVEEQFCRTPLHVWEIKCPECHATGNLPVVRKRKTRILCVCPTCSGLGFVRYVSSEITEEDAEGYSLLRDEAMDQ